jgi:hypothetical protein
MTALADLDLFVEEVSETSWESMAESLAEDSPDTLSPCVNGCGTSYASCACLCTDAGTSCSRSQ